MKSKVMTIKNEPLDDITIKEENFENDFQPLDDENTIQHSDILASLQMMPVIRKNPTAVVLEKEDTLEEQPIETSKIIAAMREAMLDTKDKTEQKQIVKTSEKKKKIFKTDEKMKKTEFSNDGKKTEDNSSDLIICNGCGMQFDNLSACHRHKKKCVYWKEDKSSDENKTNRCTHCGSVFPYLMALLKHICNKLDVADEPAMPQLCPEQPVEEVQHNSVEDIPILSPAELSRDEVIAKRLSHIESVIKEVGSASFDLSIYHEKYFKTDSSVKDTPQQLQEGAEVSTKSKNNNAFDGTKEYYNENTIRSSKFNAIEASGKLPGTKKLVLNKSPSKNTSITKSHEEKQSNKNIKVSDIFKEVKKRRRKRQKGRVKLVQKVSGAKTGIRKGIKINSLSNLKKTIVKKKRSSNFTMLMKEWEKLEKEGAVGVGKRKRLLSHSDIYVQRTRTRRSLSSSINGADYLEIESLTTDTSSINDFIEYTPSKRLRQSNSINDIVQEIGQTKMELSSTESKRKETLENKLLGENKQCSDDVNEEKSSSSNVVVTKKKPGRHSAKSISEETEKHIIETIDSIVKRSGEDTNEPTTVNDSLYGSLSTKQCAKITSKDELAKQKTAEHIDQAIEDTINKSYLTIPDDIKWENVEEVIYNVSIGSSDVFKEENNEKTSSSTICHTKPVAKGRRGRRRKGIFKTLKSKSKIESKSNINNEFDKEQMKNVNEEGSTKLDGDHCSSDKSSITPEATDNQTVTNPLKNFFSFHSTSKTNRKLSYVEEDATNTNKPKELKTKQLSIADYINISHVAKRSSESPKQMRSDVTEIIENEKLLYKKNLTANETDQSVEESLASKNEDASTTVRPSIAVLANAIEKMIKKNSKQTEIKDEMHKNDSSIEDKPNSPISSSSTDDLALSVIRDKVIQKKRKKKFKLKKLLKNKCIDVIDRRNSKINKPRVLYKDERQLRIEKLKRKKKVKVGVSRNRWEVSVIENKTEQVEILYDEEKNKNSNCSIKSFYCSVCENKFDSSYLLYEHQLTHEHKSKCVEAERQNSSLDDSDAVKYCKSIGNIINDLEKRNPTKVVQVKQKANTEANETPLLEPTSSGTVRALEENRPVLPTQPVWQTPTQEWSSRSTTPLWEGHQNWEVDSFSTGNSLGSIMDTVNKLLSSDQEVSGSSVGYSWADLQLAMGASDEEMAMLEQLGEHSLQEEYVYDSSRPSAGGDWLPPEDNPTFTDLDHPEQSVTATLSQDVRKQEPLSDSEDSKSCRGVSRSPRRLHSDYESREMLCPTCGKHFLGLPALQTHVAWSHCVPVPSVPVANLPRLKRRALLSGEEIDRRLVCFVCKEIVSSASLLEAHIQAQHTKKSDQLEPSKPNLTESAERLKSKMSLALGGLVDKALNKLLGTGKSQPEPSTSQADLNSGALQLLGRLCAARKRDGSENMKLSTDIIQLLGRLRAVSHKEEWSNRAYNRALANEVRQILSRGKTIGVTKGALQASVNNSTSASDIKPTNLLDHLAVCSPDVQERPYACPICDLRFLIPSTRNRHIARAHGKYGRRYDEEVEESHGHDEIDNGWKDCGVEANDDEARMLPMCSDCGLSFQSIQEVVQHRKEDHPRRFSADGFQEDVKPLCSEKQLLESSCEKVNQSQDTSKNDVNSLPVSDNAIDSTSTIKKKKGRPARLPESKTGENKKLSGLKNEISEEQANYKKQGRKNKQLCETTHPQENTSEDEEEHDNDSQVDSDSPNETSQEESTTTESNTPEIDKSADNLNSQQYNIHSSEENLADLTKKDRRKVSRMGNMAEEAVRVKAEAALRELNLARKSKSPSSNAKWGINAVKFTKQVSPSSPSNHPNGSPSKPRFLSLVDKKWKASTTTGLDVPKPELLDVKPDIYDFRDEDLCVNKKPFQQFKESSHQSSIVENSDSNKSMQSPNSNVTGSPRKTSNTSKTISDS
ncbi:hypothetical protein J6590_028419 [Homalodisca vitripennis]|nr:hypothetical protein J6590_028419 [Homalodisca vitripennis]